MINKKYLISGVLLVLFLISVYSQVVEDIVISDNIVNDKIFNFKPSPEGYIKVNSKSGRTLGVFGNILTGTIGTTNFILKPTDFNWTMNIKKTLINITENITHLNDETNETLTEYIDKSYYNYKLIMNNQNSSLNWTQEWTFNKNKQPKLKTTIKNNVRRITNAKIWYVNIIDDRIPITYNGKIYRPELLNNTNFINLEGNFNNLPQEIEIGDYKINFGDLDNSGFNITNVLIGDGDRFNLNNKLIVAFGVTKNNGIFPLGTTINLDPSFTQSGFKNPTIVGADLPNGWNQWANANNVKTSNNVYTTVTTVQQNLSLGNFSLLESEGGNIPSNAIIMGITVNVEFKCDGQTDQLRIELSPDEDLKLYGMIDGTNTYNIGCSPPGDGIAIIGGDKTMWSKHWDLTDQFWQVNELNNTNFRVRMRSTSINPDADSVIYVDNVQVNVAYIAPETNTTESRLDDERTVNLRGDIVHLLIADNTPIINQSNIIAYLSGDFNDTNCGAAGCAVYHAPELGHYAFEAEMTNSTSKAEPKFLANGGIIGGGYDFVAANKGNIEQVGSGGGDGDGLSEIVIINQTLTMATWFKHEAGGHAAATLIASGTNAASPFTLNRISTFAIRSILANKSTTSTCTGTTLTSADTWYHVAATYNGTTTVVYVNGVAETTCTNLRGALRQNTYTNIHFGCKDITTTTCLDGKMDEMIVLNTALNSSQILELYQNKTARFFSRGERVYPNNNIGANAKANISLILATPQGSSINISIGNQSGSSYVYGGEIALNSSGSANNIVIGTGTNFSIKAILYSGTNQFISPIMNNSVSFVGFDVTDTEYPIFSNFKENPVNSTAYVNGAVYRFNVTITSTNGTVGLDFNSANYSSSNLSSIFNSTISNLGGGTYSYYWWAYGNGTSHFYNTSNIQSYTIAKATGDINGTINGTQGNFTVLSSTLNQSIWLNATNITGYGTGKIYKNGSIINSGTMPLSNLTNLSVGFYNITFVYDGNQNYTSDTDVWWVNLTYVDAINPTVTNLIPLQQTNHTKGQTIQISANVSDELAVSSVYANITLPNGTANQLTLNLATGSKYNNSYSIPILTGQYNFTIFANDTTNNLNNSETSNFIVRASQLTISNFTSPLNNTNVTQNNTFVMNVTIQCTGESGGTCGVVSAYARYNLSSNIPDTLINATVNATPLYIIIPNYYDGWNFSVASQTLAPKGLHYNGTYFWVSGDGSGFDDNIYRYLANGTYDNWVITLLNTPDTPRGLYYNGTYFWSTDVDARVYRYNNSGRNTEHWNFSVSNQEASPRGVIYNGTYFWIVGFTSDSVFRYNNTINSTGGGNYDNWGFSVGSQAVGPTGLFYNGTYFWVIDVTTDKVFRYNADGTYDGWNFYIGNEDKNSVDLEYDGTYFYMLGDDTNKVYRYSINTTHTINNPINSPTLLVGQNYTFYWTINATGTEPSHYKVDVYINSSLGNLSVQENDTEDRIINIASETPCSVSMTFSDALSSSIYWDVLTIPITEQAAQNNNGAGDTGYNISITATGCTATLKTRGTGDLSLQGGSDTIPLGNEKWMYNRTNISVPTSTLTDFNTTLVTVDTELTSRYVFFKYFLNVSTGQPSGTYNNTLEIQVSQT